jgi:hypothetical protein
MVMSGGDSDTVAPVGDAVGHQPLEHLDERQVGAR